MEFFRPIFRHAFEKSLNYLGYDMATRFIQFLTAHGQSFLKKAVNKISALGNTKVH